MSSDISVNSIDRSKPGRKKTRKDDDICLVCGGRAIGLNFGVHTCPPCKAFFRRNAVKLGVCYFIFVKVKKSIFLIIFRHSNFNVEAMVIAQ